MPSYESVSRLIIVVDRYPKNEGVNLVEIGRLTI